MAGGQLRVVLGEMGTSLRVFGDVFRAPDMRRVQLAFISFNMAEWATFIAILVYAFEQAGPEAAGIVSVIQLIPAAVFAPFAAVLGDKLPRERMLLVAYLILTVTMGAAAVALLLDAPIPVVYVLAASAAISITLVRPVNDALMPALVRSPKELTAGYVAGGMTENLSALLGPALTGVILIFSSPGAVYATMAVGLAVSAFLVARVETRTRAADRSDEERHLLHEALAGFGVLRGDRRPRLLVVLLGSGLFVVGLLDVIIVSLAFDVFGSDGSGTGFLNAALGAGALIGSAWAVTLIGKRKLHGAMRNGMILYGAPIALIAAVPAQCFALPALAVAGSGMSVADVSGRTMLQRLVPDETLSRVFGVLEGAYMAAEGLGALLAAGLVVWLGVEGALIASGLLLPALALASTRRLGEADVGTLVPAEDIQLLHGLEIFAALGPTELERIAQSVYPIELVAGAVVITEGDAGDRFYVIKDGEVDVTKEGRLVGELEAGDYFGEIALLRDVPRAATVTARTDVDLLAIDREAFLAAVLPHAAAVGLLHEVIEARIEQQAAGRS